MWTELNYYGSSISFVEFQNMLFSDVADYFKHIYKMYQEKINIESSVTATVAHLIYQLGSSFGGGKPDRKVDTKTFLPFTIQDMDKKGLKASHRQLMERLLKEQKLSIKLTSIVASTIR